jgi:hypothetical protein
LIVEEVTLGFAVTGVTWDFFLLSSDESESDEESFLFVFDEVTGVETTGFLANGVTGTLEKGEMIIRTFLYEWNIPLDATGFFAGVSSSESLLLLDGAARLLGCCTGVDVDNGLVDATVTFFFLSSSLDESESDDESFFLIVAGLVTTGVTGATQKKKRIWMLSYWKERYVPFDATGFLFVGASSESLLLDEAAFFAGCWAGLATGVDLTGVFFFVSSSDESESDELSFFLLAVRLAGGGIAAFGVTRIKKANVRFQPVAYVKITYLLTQLVFCLLVHHLNHCYLMKLLSSLIVEQV